VQTIQNISDLGFDVSQIISHVSTIEAMEKKQADLQADILKQEERAIQLQKINNILLNSVDSHRQLLSVYQQLQYMGLGLRELDLLFKTITEISRENEFSPAMAVTKFIDDVINHYKHVGGFESRIQELKEETEHIQLEVAMLRSTSSDFERAIDENEGIPLNS
jgi:t-SNARE complex subunit (syntaxin)